MIGGRARRKELVALVLIIIGGGMNNSSIEMRATSILYHQRQLDWMANDIILYKIPRWLRPSYTPSNIFYRVVNWRRRSLFGGSFYVSLDNSIELPGANDIVMVLELAEEIKAHQPLVVLWWANSLYSWANGAFSSGW